MPGEPEPEGAAFFFPLGAGAAENMRRLYRLLEDKKHKEIVHLLLFFR